MYSDKKVLKPVCFKITNPNFQTWVGNIFGAVKMQNAHFIPTKTGSLLRVANFDMAETKSP